MPETPQEIDNDLLRRTVRGDREAATQLVQRLGPVVQRMVHRLTGWHSEAQDIVQEVFLTMLAAADSYRGQSTLRTWVAGIAVNICRRFEQKRNRRPILLTDDALDGNSLLEDSGGSSAISDWDLSETLVTGIESLRQADREVLVLRYFEELSVAELATVFAIQTHAVESRLSRARGRLANILVALQKSEASR